MATLQVTDADFEQAVLKSDKPVLVDFWAEWCGPCKRMEPILEDFSQDMADTMKVAKLNVDENPQRTQEFGVMSIPTMILFKNGQPVDQFIGVMPKDDLAAKVQPHLA